MITPKFIAFHADSLPANSLFRFKKPWVFTNGVFDVLHRGHVAYLQAAKALVAADGGSLIVALNSDPSARRLNKGQEEGVERPLNKQEDRAFVMAGLACVDAVLLFHEDTPYQLIEKIRPEIIVKGGDYDMSKLPETALVQSWGGKALALPFEAGYSTTALVSKIRGSTRNSSLDAPPA